MPELAKLIEVETLGTPGKGCRFLIDGQEFPWHVGEGVTVTVSRKDLGRLNISILAEEIRVVEKLDDQSEKEAEFVENLDAYVGLEGASLEQILDDYSKRIRELEGQTRINCEEFGRAIDRAIAAGSDLPTDGRRDLRCGTSSQVLPHRPSDQADRRQSAAPGARLPMPSARDPRSGDED